MQWIKDSRLFDWFCGTFELDKYCCILLDTHNDELETNILFYNRLLCIILCKKQFGYILKYVNVFIAKY